MTADASAPSRAAVRSRDAAGALWWWLAALSAGTASAALVALADQGQSWSDLATGQVGFSVLMAVLYPVIGAALHARHPGNRLAVVLLATGVSRAAAVAATAWATEPGVPHGTAEWLGFGLPFVALAVAPLSLLWFPDGRLPDACRRWRVAQASTPVAVVALAASMVLSWRFRSPAFLADGPPADSSQGQLASALLLVALVAAVLGVLSGVASLVARWRHNARGAVRQQIKWYLAGAVAAVVLNVAGDIAGAVLPAARALNLLGTAAILGALLIAVVRHDLWDIDRLLNRTVVYGLLSAVLLTVYVGSVLALGLLLQGLGAGQAVAVAAATLAAVTVAAPVRRHLQWRVDRRFDRRRFDAVALVRGHVRSTALGVAEPGATEALLREVLRDPTFAVRYRCRDGGIVDGWGRPASVADIRPELSGPDWLFVHAPVDPYDERVWRAVLGEAGPSLAQSRLQAEVLAQVAVVEGSRRRIVEAAAAERRRIERNLHDGAQQRLVSLAMRLRTAQRRHPDELGPEALRLLDETVADVRGSVEDLRALAAGLLPGSLVSEGLEPALLEIADRHAGSVRMTSELDHRHTAALDEVAWFVACEGVTNAVKHAADSAVQVHVTCRSGLFVLRVCDSGPGGAVSGNGLTGLQDRVRASAGELTIHSPPAVGTTLTVTLPCQPCG